MTPKQKAKELYAQDTRGNTYLEKMFSELKDKDTKK